ncbi:MAG TPA: glycosyltransferase family 1 protein [Patescibacteria group bacterium]|nr:glycosyltransferase family 1 protein [Patescibacteria group bacterium]
MRQLLIYDPTDKDELSRLRGGGRIIQILKENVSDQALFITDFSKVTEKNTLLIPSFKPFDRPLLIKRLAKKQILMIYDVIPLKYPKYFLIGVKGTFNLWLNKQTLKCYDQIITISQHVKKDLTDYLKIPPEKITAIHPTVSNLFLNSQSEYLNHKSSQRRNHDATSKIQTQNDQYSKCLEHFDFENSNVVRTSDLGLKNYCLYVGDVNWNKNLVNLARAIKIANIPCIFIGTNFNQKLQNLSHPWQKEFRDFLQEIHNDHRFIFAGYKSDEELIKLYQQACCNILLSLDEGFGFSYLEASTLGCPSVLSDIPIFHETAENTALFANPTDPKDIASKIRQIFDDDTLRTKLSLEAQERAKYFNPEKFKQQFMSLFKE